ncbi:MAG: sulfite reductase, subunit [Anaerosporomusa subterranea]|nr:sulfite reductase, subunit [Anaerosporomusa subterranea]
MAYKILRERFDQYLQHLKKDYRLFAPVVLKGKGTFTDTDSIRYQEFNSIDEICFDQKSSFSAKEVLLPITQTLFYFTEDNWSEPKVDDKKLLLFLRSCDIHAIRRLDDIYLRNGFEDPYYKVLREKVRFCLMECEQGFENCFCVSMKTNTVEEYDMLARPQGKFVYVAVKNSELDFFDGETIEIEPKFPQKNMIEVKLPPRLNQDIAGSPMWQEYSARCIGCGRCNFVCPTCSCFSMQDIFYKDNANAGERRRVWASCMVDGFTDMAGGHQFRKSQGDRMRFRVMHKVYDYEKRFGYHMCVGCGRCDDACPEYISFSNCLAKLGKAEEADQ